MATRTQQSYIQPLRAAVAEGATSPDPGTVGALVYSTTAGGLLVWSGTAWGVLAGLDALKVAKAGDTMTGDLVVPRLWLSSASQLYLSGTTVLFRNAADTDYVGIYGKNIASTGVITITGSGYLAVSATSAATSVIRLLQTGDTVNRLVVDANGKMSWGTGALTADTTLYRGTTDTLKTDDRFWINRAAFGDSALVTSVGAEGQFRLIINAAGTHTWGDGTAVGDTNLYRSAADTLRTDDAFVINTTFAAGAALNVTNPSATGHGISVSTGNATGSGYRSTVTGDAQFRLIIRQDGRMLWGDGALAGDTTLYRSAADTLKTDDSLVVGGTLTVTGQAILGSVTSSAGMLVTRDAGFSAYYAFTTGDTQPRYRVMTDGQISWGPGGSTVVDTNLYRVAADSLQTDDRFNIVTNQAQVALAITNTNAAAIGISENLGAATNHALRTIVTAAGDIQYRYIVDASGKITWGSGALAGDANLYRLSAGVLKTDTALSVGTDLTVAGTLTANGTVTGIDKTDVGLSNVDNTSDVNKPVSTAQGTADGLRVLKAGDTMTGPLAIDSSLTIGPVEVRQSYEATFATAANEKRDLYFQGPFYGAIEVTIASYWELANATGVITALYSLGVNATGDFDDNTMTVLAAQGLITDHFNLMPCVWDAANSRYKIPIAHRTSILNRVAVGVRVIGVRDIYADQFQASAGVSAVYTTDATVATVNVLPLSLKAPLASPSFTGKIYTPYVETTRAAGTDYALLTNVGVEAFARFGIHSDGQLMWGSGASGIDTTLYRSAANVLKTDDSLEVVGTLTAPTAAPGTNTTQVATTAFVAAVKSAVDTALALLPKGIMATPVVNAGNGTATAANNTEVRDAVLGNYVFTAVTGRLYRVVSTGTFVAATADVRVVARVRDGGASTPSAASTLLAECYVHMSEANSGAHSFVCTATFTASAGTHTLSAFTLSADSAVATPSTRRDLYVEDIGPG